MNIIQQATLSSIKSNEITLADKSGSGNMVINSASGCTILFNGDRRQLSNTTVNYSIPIHQSCGIWTNTSSANIQYILPALAPSGTAALIIRTGGLVNISPGPSARIWCSASGFFRNTGHGITLASSGSKCGLVSDGNNRWYPIIENGTIL